MPVVRAAKFLRKKLRKSDWLVESVCVNNEPPGAPGIIQRTNFATQEENGEATSP
jgi:hypothetical protein